MDELREKYEELVRKLNEASKAYYGGQEELLSNYEWDAMFDEAAALEKQTGYILPESPTQNTGMEEGSGDREPHEFPALSLAKTKQISDLQKWAEDKSIWLSWKLDGLTLVLTYDNGKLTKIVTRGNGSVGTNITYLKNVIAGFPLKIKYKGHMVVRGEATISYTDFELINDTIEDDDEKYANPRNLASGTLSLDDPEKVKERRVHFNAFTLVHLDDPVRSWGERMNLLKKEGFTVVESEAATAETLPSVIEKWTEKVETGKMDIPVDGLVICFDDTEYAATGSVTGHHATRAGYAFKWQDVSAKSKLTAEEALKVANKLGYPVLLRPSYVLGGQNMIIAHSDSDVEEYMAIITATELENPVLVDKYMMGTEVEVDAICDGEDFVIPGIMEHVERAGIHSGDSISIYPCQNLSSHIKRVIIDYTEILAKALHVIGLVNIQYVVYNHEVFVIEVNPRSSRTVPYISKVTGVPMVDLATKIILGKKLKDMGYKSGLYPNADYVAVKVPVFSFEKLHDVDTQLGPEMKSTGECLGIAKTFGEALFKGLTAAGYKFHDAESGDSKGVIISVRDTDKNEVIEIASRFEALGFKIYATSGTASVLNRNMIAANHVYRIHEEKEPNVITLLESGEISYVISTSETGRKPSLDSVKMRRKAVERSIVCLTAIDTANALLDCLEMSTSIDDIELVDITKI